MREVNFYFTCLKVLNQLLDYQLLQDGRHWACTKCLPESNL